MWVDYEDVAMREHHQGGRFIVEDSQGGELLQGDDWTEVLCVVMG